MRLTTVIFTIESDIESLRVKGLVDKFTSNINMFLFFIKFITIHKQQGQLFLLAKYYFSPFNLSYDKWYACNHSETDRHCLFDPILKGYLVIQYSI